MRRARSAIPGALLLAVVAFADPVYSQSGGPVVQQVLVLSQERLLTESKKGQLILAEEEAQKSERAEQGLRIEKELEAEELELAEARGEMDPAEFEKLAEDFDQKVVLMRMEDQKQAEQLAAEFEERRKQFFSEIVPIVAAIMNERGAAVVLEQRNVLFTGPNIDITADVIARMDKAAGLN